MSWLLVLLPLVLLVVLLLSMLDDLVVDVLELVCSLDSFIECGWRNDPCSISNKNGVQPF